MGPSRKRAAAWGVCHELDRAGAELVHGRHIALVSRDVLLGQSGGDGGGGLVEQLRRSGRQAHPHALDIGTEGGAVDGAEGLAGTAAA
ncbi:hypothetical protein GCM10025786_34060 [Nocardioides caeni]